MTDDWRNRARCRTSDPELFFPDPTNKKRIARAKAVCNNCPVQFECLNWALETSQGAGIWGGKDEAELRVLRRTRVTA